MRHGTAGWMRTCCQLCLVAAVCTQTGCSLFVMAGKMFFGDPKVQSAFSRATHVDLVKEEKKVLVVCSTPEYIKDEFPSLQFDLIDGITRRLKLHGIKVINPDDVATWLDGNGGQWNDPTELIGAFDADYIVHFDLNRFDYREENSPTLYRGRAFGNVYVYEVRNRDGRKQVSEVFVREFTSEHPKTYPVSVDRMSAKVFRKRFLDRISDQLAQMFYNYRVSERIE